MPIENFLKIRYILGWGTHIRIFLDNNKDPETYTVNMGYLDALLPAELFVLIDKGVKVNMKWVTGYQKFTLKNNPLKIVKIKITLRGGKRLTVTKNHVPDFLALLPAFPGIKPKTEKCFLRRCFNK